MLLGQLYQNPKAQGADTLNIDPQLLEQHFEEFYEDVHGELSEFGMIEEMHVLDNIGDHMVGNVYVMFEDEEGCAKALTALNGRFYAGRPILPEFSPVTDFHDARCRQYDEGVCGRGGHCNFMHCKKLGRHLMKKLRCDRHGGTGNKDKSRSRSPGRGGGGGGGGRGGGGRDDRRDDRGRDDRRDSRRDRGGGDDRRDSRRDRGDDRRDSRRDRDEGKDSRRDRGDDRGREERRDRGGGDDRRPPEGAPPAPRAPEGAPPRDYQEQAPPHAPEEPRRD